MGFYMPLLGKNPFKAANRASQFGDMIPHPVPLNGHSLASLDTGDFTAWCRKYFFTCAIKGCKHYANQYADTISLFCLVVSWACLIWFGNIIRNFIPINLVVLLFLIHTLYLGIRAYLKRNWYRFR